MVGWSRDCFREVVNGRARLDEGEVGREWGYPRHLGSGRAGEYCKEGGA